MAMSLAEEDATTLLQVWQSHSAGSPKVATPPRSKGRDRIALSEMPCPNDGVIPCGGSQAQDVPEVIAGSDIGSFGVPVVEGPGSWDSGSERNFQIHVSHDFNLNDGVQSTLPSSGYVNGYNSEDGVYGHSGGGGYEEGSCKPKCGWECSKPECDEVCKPKCQAPRCETRCAAVSSIPTSGCKLACGQPHCSVVCPNRLCPEQNCPVCTTQCSKPMCKLRCAPVEAPNCREVCENPACSWDCKAQTCPKPSCQMRCETPKSCRSRTYRQMPALGRDEIVVGHFEAPISLQQQMAEVHKRPKASLLTMSVPVVRTSYVAGSSELQLVNSSLQLPVVMTYQDGQV